MTDGVILMIMNGSLNVETFKTFLYHWPGAVGHHRWKLLMSNAFKLSVVKSPNEAIALTNCVALNPSDLASRLSPSKGTPFVFRISTGHDVFLLSAISDAAVSPGQAAFSGTQRQWMILALGDIVTFEMVDPSILPFYELEALHLSVDLLRKKGESPNTFDTERMCNSFLSNSKNLLVSVGQPLIMDYAGCSLALKVISLAPINQATQLNNGSATKIKSLESTWGIISEGTELIFSLGPDATIKLSGGKALNQNAVVHSDFRFEDLGIGGLDDQFWTIFRRAFVSRIYPPDLVEKLGIQHVKGLILYGPPGTGKTLMARQIAKMLRAREPKIVNGPEILNKYVGQSEENIRNLFKDAEAEYKAKGDASQLHIIIFDEIDAICKQRGGRSDGTGVGDSVVNQLLAKMDGVDELNNILIIGMTNRLDLLDEALLRPKRFEIKLPIPLPDEKGRIQILKIHTAEMRKNGILRPSSDSAFDEAYYESVIEEISRETNNYTGAELVGLVNSATSFSLNRHILIGGPNGSSKADSDQFSESGKKGQLNQGVHVPKDISARLAVTREDFMRALGENKAAYGLDVEDFESYGHEAANDPFSSVMHGVLEEIRLVMKQVREWKDGPALSSILLHGEAGSGKSALAARLALDSGFPFVKLISPQSLLTASPSGGEAAKQAHIAKIFSDAYKSDLSLIVIDDVEDVIEFVDIGPRFSSSILQTIRALMKRMPPPPNHRLLIVLTTRDLSLMNRLGITPLVKTLLAVPTLDSVNDLERLLMRCKTVLSDADIRGIIEQVKASRRAFSIPIRTLLDALRVASQDVESASARFMQVFSTYYV